MTLTSQPHGANPREGQLRQERQENSGALGDNCAAVRLIPFHLDVCPVTHFLCDFIPIPTVTGVLLLSSPLPDPLLSHPPCLFLVQCFLAQVDNSLVWS